MDDDLKRAIEIARRRGHSYIKGEVDIEELSGKLGELAMFLLMASGSLESAQGKELRDELNDIQNKIDDCRKTLFNVKGQNLSRPHLKK